jgi:branched-chain amino acid transport system ATP-binding protein
LVALIAERRGKTTCFNLVNGQLAPDAGSPLEGERSTACAARRSRAGVGRTFQVAATFASMTVRENVQLALSRARAHRPRRPRDRLCMRAKRTARARG